MDYIMGAKIDVIIELLVKANDKLDKIIEAAQDANTPTAAARPKSRTPFDMRNVPD